MVRRGTAGFREVKIKVPQEYSITTYKEEEF
jgi:hypothetical protein